MSDMLKIRFGGLETNIDPTLFAQALPQLPQHESLHQATTRKRATTDNTLLPPLNKRIRKSRGEYYEPSRLDSEVDNLNSIGSGHEQNHGEGSLVQQSNEKRKKRSMKLEVSFPSSILDLPVTRVDGEIASSTQNGKSPFGGSIQRQGL
jgi:hypothetical protein